MSFSVGRRRTLASALASTLSSGIVVASGHAAEDPLSAKFSRNKLYFGTAVRIEQVMGEQDLRTVVLRECDWLTPEVALKWGHVERSPGAFDFRSMDGLTNFAPGMAFKSLDRIADRLRGPVRQVSRGG